MLFSKVVEKFAQAVDDEPSDDGQQLNQVRNGERECDRQVTILAEVQAIMTDKQLFIFSWHFSRDIFPLSLPGQAQGLNAAGFGASRQSSPESGAPRVWYASQKCQIFELIAKPFFIFRWGSGRRQALWSVRCWIQGFVTGSPENGVHRVWYANHFALYSLLKYLINVVIFLCAQPSINL